MLYPNNRRNKNKRSQQNWINELKNRESDRDWVVAFLLSMLFGLLGADRFYLGYIGLGFWKMVTLGGLGTWWIVDLIIILLGKMRDADGELLSRPF